MKKICTKCKINKPLKDYYKDNRRKDGRTSECKSCHSEYQKSDKGKATQAKAGAKYYKTDKGKVAHAKANAKYDKTDKGKAANARGQAKYNKKYRKAWIPILKEIYGKIACTKCGYFKCFAALEFHHRKSETKKFQISHILNYKVTTERIKEIKKCDLLCANCHREHHNGL